MKIQTSLTLKHAHLIRTCLRSHPSSLKSKNARRLTFLNFSYPIRILSSLRKLLTSTTLSLIETELSRQGLLTKALLCNKTTNLKRSQSNNLLTSHSLSNCELRREPNPRQRPPSLQRNKPPRSKQYLCQTISFLSQRKRSKKPLSLRNSSSQQAQNLRKTVNQQAKKRASTSSRLESCLTSTRQTCFPCILQRS